ncbi:MAG: type II toxin-antitoxin system RelE/ParE family toxin [bacterium]|nr:type II toxin-antitoxin system RelE/ParE family toxin [bacterium]
MKVTLSKDAQKQYERLPKSQQAKILKKIMGLEQNPNAGKKLEGELKGFRSLRAWPYRILYEINKAEQRIEVHKIAHRQGAYK